MSASAAATGIVFLPGFDGMAELRAEFVPDSTAGGPGDKLHPNRAGYLAMAMAIDLKILMLVR